MTTWSTQQQQAIDKVGRWLKTQDKPYFMLAGYAGTGKTTLAKHLAATVNGPVYFAAYTGKAAHVLTKSGATNVSTIHKLIYQPKEKSQQRLKQLQSERAQLLTHKPVPTTLIAKLDKAIEQEQRNLTRPAFQLNSESPLIGASLLVVDEYSMIDETMGADLLSFGCPILALGDPGQLPPVNGKSFFTSQPDVHLIEIHRQAADNPIIWMSQEVREGRVLRSGEYGDSRVLRRGDVPKPDLADMVLGCNQLLVGRNATRISSNQRARELLGRTNQLPQVSDKVVCLRNNHDIGILNGQLWEVTRDAKFDGEWVGLNLKDEDGNTVMVDAHPDYFHGGKPEYYAKKDAEEFDYGYALTVHKAQGSQWNDVLLFDEWYGRDRKEWLYTAVTRAAERIDVVQM